MDQPRPGCALQQRTGVAQQQVGSRQKLCPRQNHRRAYVRASPEAPEHQLPALPCALTVTSFRAGENVGGAAPFSLTPGAWSWQGLNTCLLT